MQAFKDILGNDIPNLLGEFRKLENKIAPELAKLNELRDKLPSDLLAKFDEVQLELKQAKEKLKQYGNHDFK